MLQHFHSANNYIRLVVFHSPLPAERFNELVALGKVVPRHHGEEVVIDVPPPRPTELIAEDRPLDILFEDEFLLVLNKPTGWTVHPGSGQQSSVYDVLHLARVAYTYPRIRKAIKRAAKYADRTGGQS